MVSVCVDVIKIATEKESDIEVIDHVDFFLLDT